MRTVSICWIVFMAAALSLADNKKNDGKFSPGPIASYPAKQTNDHVTVAVAAYGTEELAHTAFGKLDPNQYGVLPLLVIIQNDTDEALKLDRLEVQYTSLDGRHVDATPAADVQTLGGPERPRMPTGSPLPPLRKHENPLQCLGNRRPQSLRPSCCRRMSRPTDFFIFRPAIGRVRNSI